MPTLALFSIISAIFILPYLFKVGVGPVTGTYKGAAWSFWLGLNPYFYGIWGGDWYKYSPFFAFCYTPFALLPSVPQAVAWALVNIVFYWWGILRWFSFGKGTSGWLWFAAILCSMELDGSSRYQQVNALLVGMILIGLADYRDGKFTRSGSWLSLATNFKLLPVFFLFTQKWNRPFLRGVILGGVAAILVPVIFLGPKLALQWHVSWVEIILKDMSAEGLLDIQSVLSRWDLPTLGLALKIVVAVGTAMSLVKGINAIAVLLMGLILISPRTESATFVLAAPAFLFIAGKGNTFAKLAFVLCAFFITLSFNDVWPKVIFSPTKLHYATKTLGMLGLWILGMTLLWQKTVAELLFGIARARKQSFVVHRIEQH